jgi:hypothetical protein
LSDRRGRLQTAHGAATIGRLFLLFFDLQNFARHGVNLDLHHFIAGKQLDFENELIVVAVGLGLEGFAAWHLINSGPRAGSN